MDNIKIEESQNKNMENKSFLSQSNARSIAHNGNQESQEGHKQELIPFDDVLTDIGQGKYQYVIYIVMALIGMTEGSQVTIFTLTIPILKHQWNVEDYLNSLQASLVFVGFLLGSMMSGQFADRYGRKWPFLISSCLTMIITLSTALSTNIYQLIILRLMMGLLVGFFGPLGMTLLTEITPQKQRGRYMSLVTISVAIGQLFALISGYFILENLQEGNWRLLIFVTSIPGVLSWIVIMFWLDESARYLICSSEFEKGFVVLQRMNDVNGRQLFAELSDRVKQGLTNWSNKLNEKFNNDDKASISALFKGDLKVITPIIWINMFCLSLVYFGIVILLPSLIDKINQIEKEDGTFINTDESQDMSKLIFSTSTEMVAGVLASIMIEVQGFGRKNSMINFGIIQSITLFMVYYDVLGRFIFWITLAKFYQVMNYAFSYQFIAEIYATKIRTTGIGMANSVGRAGGIIMPWVCAKLQEYELLLPFLLFSAVSLAMSLLINLLPYDTLGRDIDKIEDDVDNSNNVRNVINAKHVEKDANTFISLTANQNNSQQKQSTSLRMSSVIKRAKLQLQQEQQQHQQTQQTKLQSNQEQH